MTTRLCLLFTMLTVIYLTSCMKSGRDTRACDLSTGRTIAQQHATVIYKVTSVGSAYLNSITYEDGKGSVTTEKPGLPFTATVSITSGSFIGMQVKGIAMEGELVIEQLTIINSDTLRVREVCAD